ncbi:MAG: glycosyltransferase family 2 protein [Winogradskyella sp.]|uniref:glycosyltransferase n=1 Tax=Winogradskyella sp. TaxID=1883156 RepID=UPI0017A19E26|nr:glycosyltransferase family 2 protein [Winogradskyella sp.]MBT8244044.1 glycosyltransferase family 2 protein [Winogradskyella sp.]NNK23494.1 glycosyltransferase family 2 protein [Winogradskyella sp.]
MKFYIIIPAHNEEDSIALTLESLACQTHLPTKVVVVNDNSTDKTSDIIKRFTEKYDWMTSITISSSNKHIPGAKIINAFYKGFETLDDTYDIICKFDADIILPTNYLKRLTEIFSKNENVGIAGGLAYIKKNDQWIYENISNKNHVRGPFKAYRKECFEAIGGLKNSIGWDTVDTLLAKYYDWEVKTDHNLIIKHLKPTGNSYTKASKYLQGEALYKMRYGFIITLISAFKMAYKKQNLNTFFNYIVGYFKASEHIVTKEEGKFIRKLRWRGVFGKAT